VIADPNRAVTERREQASLRRIAALVAQGVEPQVLFAVVAEEVGRVVGAPSVAVARYESDDTATVCGTFPPEGPLFRTGSRVSLKGVSVIGRIREHGEPARIDDYTQLEGDIAGALQIGGIRSGVGVPLEVAGRVWGSIVAWSAERLPEDFEARLAAFTELLAAAIANTEAREALARLADEQAALRRVATLVAENAAPAEIFAAVSAEVDRVFALDRETFDVAAVGRFEPGPELVVVGISKSVDVVPLGSRWPPDELFAPTHVLRTGRSARIGEEDLASVGGDVADFLRSNGYLSQVASPIVVEGRLWGAMSVNSMNDLPPDTEERLERFTDLVATAIGSAKARETLSRLADEQAALRRVATLVAQGAPPADVFATVSVEVDHLLRLAPDQARVCVVRFDPGPEHVVVGVSRTLDAVPLGSRWPPVDLYAPTRVLRTGRSARVREDDLAAADGPEAEFLRDNGYLSQVSSPIVVEGRLWGAISANSTETLPPDTEARLEKFIELIATAIANTESRKGLHDLADDQTALRRVATLVAEEVAPDRIFAAVCEQVGHLLEADITALEVFPGDGTVILTAAWNREGPSVQVGRQLPLEPDTIAARIVSTHAPARRDGHDDAHIHAGPFGRDLQLTSTVGAPIVVGGRLWGALMAGTRCSGPWAEEAETRLTAFTDLIATAIANAESRDALARLGDEQAALRRVATLVAEGAPPDALFRAVADEVASVVGPPTVTLSHHHADGSFTVVAATNNPGFPVGSRWPLDGPSLAATIHETGRTARIDDYSNLGGAVAAAMHDSSFRAAAGSPIVVDGKVWGHISVAAKGAEPLPAGTEQRLLEFTELISTAISNAESRDALARLANEQAALRRVATLVARDAPPGEVFDAVAMEVGTLLDTDITVVGRYDGDGAATAIGSWSASPGGVPVGTRSVLGGRNVLTLVAETGKPARVDGYDDASGEAADIARRHGWSSSIAAPISVEGRLWGVMLVATQGPAPFPGGSEERLAAFTDLVATALANAQAHDAVRRFGEEQAALGRVATLVAGGAAPEQVFTAVVEEVSTLLGLDWIEFLRYDGDNTATVIAASGEHPFPPGSTWSLEDPSVMAMVARTGRAARIDDYGALKGKIARAARSAGFRSAIGAPLTVEGDLWGVIIAISTDPEPIPERSEARLAQFTELVATAVANAEARQALEHVAAEQATLQRIATLVAQGVQPEELFGAVAEETAATFDAITALMRFEHDPAGVVLVGVSKEADLSIGTRWDFAEGMSSAEVYRTGRPARLSSPADHWSSLSGPAAEAGHRLGIVSQVSCPIVVEGGVWGVITVNARGELPLDTEQRLVKFTDLVTTAIANAEGKSELAASRRRIVTAADEARRRIERDLHDGIQQRLIALTFRARAMTRKPPDELPGLAAELSEGLKDVSDELREVSRGIHPTILTEAGLGPALRALARRSDVPVDLDVSLAERLPAPVEAAAYYIASEALTNVAKHSRANVVRLIAAHDNGFLTLEVLDDGVGGVDAGRGSGILGLTDRVEALGGTISIISPPRGGTKLSVCLPIAT
jgi:GAF domain-containing protein